MLKHQEEHPNLDHPNCYACKISTIGMVGHRISLGNDRDTQKRTNSELKRYESQRKQGIQPDGTKHHALEKSDMWSQELGMAYRGDDVSGMLEGAGLTVTESIV